MVQILRLRFGQTATADGNLPCKLPERKAISKFFEGVDRLPARGVESGSQPVNLP